MKPMIGIDLGTTNTVIAYLKDTIPKILPNHLNQSTTPSIVSYTPNIVVGHAAKTQQNRITSIKRLIGRKHSALDHIPFTYAHTNGDVW
ncbi:Hsp70 ATPase ssc1, partial [Conglomerata obtusa]